MNPINDEFYKIINESKDFKGMFSTKEELESTINKNPKEFYSIINESEDFKGIFKDENDLLNTAGLKKKVSSEDGGKIQEPITGNASKIASAGEKLKSGSFFDLMLASKSGEQKLESKSSSFFDYKIPDKFEKNVTPYGVQYNVNLPNRKLLGTNIDFSHSFYEASPEERNIWSTQVDQIDGIGIDYWANVPKEKKYVGALGEKSINKNFLSSTGVNKITADYLKHLNQTDKESYTLMNTLINGAGKKFDYNDVYEYDSERNRDLIKQDFKGLEPYLQKTQDGNFILKGAKDSDELNFLGNAIEHQMNIINNDFLYRTNGGKENLDENYEKYRNALTELNGIRNDIMSDSEYSSVISKNKALQQKAKEDQQKADELYERMYKYSPKIAGLYYGVYRPVKSSVLSTMTGFWELPQMVGLDIPEFKSKAKEGQALISSDVDPTQLQGTMFSNPRTIIPNLTRMVSDMATMAVGGRVLGGGKLATIGVGVINQYNNYFDPAKKEAMAKGYTEAESENIANINGVVGAFLTSMVESFNLNIEKSLLGETVKKEITDNTIKVLAKGGTYKDVLKESWGYIKKEVPKENLEEFTNMVTDKATNAMTNERYGLELDSSFNAEEIGEIMFYTSVIGSLSAIREGKTPNKLEKAYLFDALNDEDIFKSKMSNMVDRGVITKEQAKDIDDYMSEVKTVVKGLPDMKINRDNFVKVIGLLEQKRLIKERRKGAYVDEVFKEKTEAKDLKEGAEIDAEINKIVSEKAGDDAIEIKDGQIKKEYDTKGQEQQVEGTVGSGETTEQRFTEQGSSSEEAKASGVLQEGEEIESPTLYHATVEDFESLKPFSHIGTKEQADKRVPEGREGKRIISGKMKGKVVHLGEDVVNWRKQILEETYEGGEKAFSQKFFKENPELKGEELQKKYDEEIQKYLKEKGIVGFSYDNKTEGEGLSYIIADPNAFIEDKVNEQVDIEDGHHRYIAYKEAGVKEVPVVNEKGEEMMMPIEKLRPTEKLEEKDRSTIDSIKESIGKGEKIEPIKVVSEVKIDEVRPQEKEGSERWDKKVMGKLDELEKNLDDFSKETLGINLPVAVAKSALKVMKGVIKTAGTIQDVVQAGIDHIKNTDWYLGLGENDRRLVEDEIEYRFNKPFGVAKKTAGRKAKANRKRISRAARNKNTLANDKPVFKSFATLNPSKVDDLDKYIEISNKILDIKKTGDRDITNEDIEKYVSEQTEILKEKQKAELLSDNQDLVDAGIISADMSLEDIQTILENPDSIEDEEKKKILKEKKVEKVKTLKSKIDVKIATLLEDMEPETELQGEVFSALQNIDLDGLKLDQLNIVNRVVDNIITNGSFAKAGDIILMNEIQQANRELAVELDRLGIDSIESFIKNNQNALNSLFKEYQIGIASLPSLIKKMTLNRDLAAVVRRVTGIQELLSGHAKVINEMDSLNEGFEKLVDNDNSSYDSQIKQSFYSIVSQDFGGNENDIQKEFERNKDLVRQTAVRSAQDEVRRLFDDGEIDKSKYEDFNGKRNSEGEFEPGLIEQGVATSSDLKKEFPEGDFTELAVYDSIIKDAKNSEEVREKLNDSEKKMVDYFRSKYAEIQERLFENAEMFDNNIPEYVNNYLPLLYTNSPYTTQEQKEADIVKDIENNIFMSDLINTSKSGTTISRVRPKVLKKGKKLSTNFHYDMIRKFREALYQVNTLKARKQVVKTLSNQEFADNFGVNNTETLREAVLRTVMAHQNAFEKNSFVNATMKVTNKLAGWGTRMALASPITGFFKQTLPVLSGAAVKLGKNSHFLWTLPRAKDGIFKYSNLHERIKTKAGFQTDTYTNDKELSTIHNQYKKGFIKAYGWTEEKAGKAADAVMWSITKGDQFAAKKAWMAYYASYLNKRKGIKSINWEKEFKNPSKEATAYADQLLEETQSTNSFATLGNFLLKKRDWGDILRNIYAPFSTFVLNQRSRLMNASRMIRKGNAKEGVEEIGAVAVESVVFSGIRISIGLGVIALSKELLQQLGYSDDEADELIKDITLEDAIKRTGGDLAKDMLISGFVGADDKGAEAINWVYKKASGDSKDLLYVNKTTDRDYADWLGTYGIAFDNFADIYEDYKKLSEGYDDVVKGGGFGKEDLIKKPLTEREKDAFTLFLIHDIFKLVGSEQIFSNTINKVRRAIEKDMVQERGGAIDIKMYMKGDKYKEDKEKGRSRLSGGKITGGSLKRGKLKPRK